MLAQFLANRPIGLALQDGLQTLLLFRSSPSMVAARLAVLRAAALLTAWLRGNSTGGLAIWLDCNSYRRQFIATDRLWDKRWCCGKIIMGGVRRVTTCRSDGKIITPPSDKEIYNTSFPV